MRRVVWSGTAAEDYLDILQHIAEDNPDAADRVVQAIRQTGDKLADFATGHPDRVSGTYEKSVSRLPYVIAYALSDDRTVVTVLHDIHTARNWPREAWPT